MSSVRARSARCSTITACIAAALFAKTLPAVADDLTVLTTDAGTWPAAVAALQADVRADGRLVHVVVTDANGSRVECREYSLQLDEVSQQAFTVGACDPNTRATAVTLVHRSALFEAGDLVPTPRAAGISAVSVRTGGARGGAANVGGSEVACSVAVRPFLRDLEHGTNVYLTPGRFTLHPVTSSVSAQGTAQGWTLQSFGHAALTVEYEVTDTQTHAVVVHDRATLDCGEGTVGAPPPSTPQATVPTRNSHPYRGDPHASVVLDEYSDFQCPFCARLQPTLDQLLDQNPHLRIVWHDNPLPFHNNAMLAAEAAREAFAQQGHAGFWRYHNALFAHPTDLSRPALEAIARGQQLDMARFQRALDQHTHRAEIAADVAAAQARGAQGTPACFINGTVVSGAVPFEDFQRVIDAAHPRRGGTIELE